MTMRVAVLGAGLQGACVAMELASRGIKVDLYEKNELCVTQASAQNEGKIHLGYVYANDRSLRTARKMIEGAFAFTPLMRRWIGNAVDTLPVSKPFYYAVHKASLLTVDEVESHLASCHAIALENRRNTKTDYFGFDPCVRPARLSDSECDSLLNTRLVSAVFRTPEIAIDPELLATAVRARLSADSRIRCRLGTLVQSAEAMADGVWIESLNGSERTRQKYDHAVNCLWAERLRVDQTAGVEPARPWIYRIKYNLRLRSVRQSQTIPSVTIVLGPFGDIVGYDPKSFYLSWYPVGMRGASSELAPPNWPLAVDENVSIEIRSGIIEGLRAIVPSVAQFSAGNVESCRLKAGIIFAWGESDIDDAGSGLHERHMIGPESHGRYHTIDTGKLTTAPLFANEMADRITHVG